MKTKRTIQIRILEAINGGLRKVQDTYPRRRSVYIDMLQAFYIVQPRDFLLKTVQSVNSGFKIKDSSYFSFSYKTNIYSLFDISLSFTEDCIIHKLEEVLLVFVSLC